MREIKFRAWDKKNKRMKGKAWPKLAINSDGTFEFPKDDLYIIMQYTGIKDKSGKEIYEGDLVLFGGKSALKKYEPFTVKFIDGAFRGYNSIENTTLIGTEIVGNIYED